MPRESPSYLRESPSYLREGNNHQASGRLGRCLQHQPGPAAALTSRRPAGSTRARLLTVYCVQRVFLEVTFSLQVDADFELHNFRALCELESGIPAAESQVRWAEIGASLRS